MKDYGTLPEAVAEKAAQYAIEKHPQDIVEVQPQPNPRPDSVELGRKMAAQIFAQRSRGKWRRNMMILLTEAELAHIITAAYDVGVTQGGMR